MKRGKKGQSANEAALIVIFLTFLMIVTIAAVSDDIIQASDNNYKALLQDLADVIENEANIAFASENGYTHSFSLPQTLNGQPYAISIINSTQIGSQANTTILSVSSTRPNVPLNVTRLLPGSVLGTVVIGPNTVRKEQDTVTLMALPLPLPLPAPSSVNPSSGSTAGGTSVTIYGSDFVATPSVALGGVAATNVVFVSSTQLTASTPAHAAGAVDVVVTNPDLQFGTLANGFTYVLPPPPTVSGFSPRIGPFSGGTSVTITGTGFVSGAGVAFGGVASGSVTFVSSTQLTAVTPASAVGYVTVSVINPDSQSANAPYQFLYRISPVAIGTVFVTSSSYKGNLGGLAGADAKCQALADAGTFGGTWTAWLSTSTPVHAKNRITDTSYRLLDNKLVANSKADLTDGTIANRINTTDGGASISSPNVWTGTSSSGNYVGGSSSFSSCVNWASSSLVWSGRNGLPTSTTGSWTAGLSTGCNNFQRLYCFRTS